MAATPTPASPSTATQGVPPDGLPHAAGALAPVMAPAVSPAVAAADVASRTTSQPMNLLKAWLHGVKIAHVGHTRAAVVYERRAKAMGVITTLISAIIATAIFSSAAASSDVRLLMFAGFLSAAAVVVSALSTFLNYGQLAANHRQASVAYGSLRRRIEMITVLDDTSGLGQTMPQIAEAWLKLEEASPNLPAGIFDYARTWVTKRAVAGERDGSGS